MESIKDVGVNAEDPESVLSVINLDNGDNECTLHISLHHRHTPFCCNFQQDFVALEQQNLHGTLLIEKMNINLCHKFEDTTVFLDKNNIKRTQPDSVAAASRISHNIKLPSTDTFSKNMFKISLPNQCPILRRSRKTMKLNDPQEFTSPAEEIRAVVKLESLLKEHICSDNNCLKCSVTNMNVSVYTTTAQEKENHMNKTEHRKDISCTLPCVDSVGEPLLQPLQEEFVKRLKPEVSSTVRCEQIEFKTPYGDQSVENVNQVFSQQFQETMADAKEEKGKNSQYKGCFQWLLQRCFLRKHRKKYVESYCTSTHIRTNEIVYCGAKQGSNIVDRLGTQSLSQKSFEKHIQPRRNVGNQISCESQQEMELKSVNQSEHIKNQLLRNVVEEESHLTSVPKKNHKK